MTVILEIWASFRRMPLWVQGWVLLILMPVNLIPLLLLDAPYGGVIALMSVGGMAPNIFIMLGQRGLSKAMGIPHLIVWTPLVVFLVWLLSSGVQLPAGYTAFLKMLLGVNVVSLAFDYADVLKWWRGDRAIA